MFQGQGEEWRRGMGGGFVRCQEQVEKLHIWGERVLAPRVTPNLSTTCAADRCVCRGRRVQNGTQINGGLNLIFKSYLRGVRQISDALQIMGWGVRQSNDVDWELWRSPLERWLCWRILPESGTLDISLGLTFFGKVLQSEGRGTQLLNNGSSSMWTVRILVVPPF